MGISQWISETKHRFNRGPLSVAATESMRELYIGALRRANSVIDYGTPIYEEDWDLLIVLDACRVDVLEEVAAEYSFIGEIDTRYSRGSASYEWMEANFSEEYHDEMQTTVHITGNPFSSELLRKSEFEYLDAVWEYAWDESVGTTPTTPITNSAVKRSREYEWDRMIVHYMQPHFPAVPVDDDRFHSSPDELGERTQVWEDLKRDVLSHEDIWNAYRENLRYALEDVEVLLQNIDAETVVITADHSNAFGEYGLYGHPNVPVPILRKVPWVETTATDTGDLEPKLNMNRAEGGKVEDRLRDLGYR